MDSKGTGTGFGNRAGPKKMSENMTIAVRIRPPNKSEMKKKAARIVSTCTVTRPGSSSGRAEQRLVVLDPQMTDEIGVDQLPLQGSSHKFPRNIASTFRFDHCYWSPLPGISMPKVNDKGHMFATQQDIHGGLGQRCRQRLEWGVQYHLCVWPQGHWQELLMFGDMDGGMKHDSSCLGLLPRVYAEIVEKVQASHSQDTKCHLSMLEIYNEKVVDYSRSRTSTTTTKSAVRTTQRISRSGAPYSRPRRDEEGAVTSRSQVLSLVNEVLERRRQTRAGCPERLLGAPRARHAVVYSEITPDVFQSPSQWIRTTPTTPTPYAFTCGSAWGRASVESVDTWAPVCALGPRLLW